MNDYDFKNLSPWEFEQLSRDLLKEALGIDFELFKSGRDFGIDLRYSSDKRHEIIAQCKHYANSTIHNLTSDLRKHEIAKIKKLSPRRYILITSLGLTPANKSEISTILDGYILSSSDIVSKETLNSWIRDYPHVEKNHINLWASSTNILERILHSGIFNYSIAQNDLLKTRLNYYVKNRSFDEAKDILEKQHFCIIAGIPGIGKTTLAEMLLIEYMDNGYEPIRISSDIDEAFRTYNPNEKRIYYYDDFLGQTGLEHKLNKNEDQRIIDFCKLCAKSKKTLFVLTTREYILNQAKFNYEKIAKSGLDINKCVIDISSYALLDRAKILYNHIYFGNISSNYKEQVLKDNNYLKIIKHPSFNPRVIEWMGDSSSFAGVPAGEYVEEVLRRLNNPAAIWEHVYKYQIVESTQHLLLTLLSLPSVSYLSDCKHAFERFRSHFSEHYRKPRSHNEFNTSLKESEDNFIRLDLSSGKQIIQFHNPSIRDYLSYYLSQDIELLIMLLRSTIYFDQLVTLWNSFDSLEGNPFRSSKELIITFQEQLATKLGTSGIRLTRFYNISGTYSFHYAKSTTKNQCRFILNSGLSNPHQTLIYSLKDELDTIFNELESVYDWGEIRYLLNSINNSRNIFNLDFDKYLSLTLDTLTYNLNQTSDYRQLAEICDSYPSAHSKLSKHFSKYITDLDENLDDELSYINSVDDIGSLEDCLTNIEKVNNIFHGNLEHRISQINDLIEDLIQEEEAVPETTNNNQKSTRLEDNKITDIISLFETLI